MSEQAIITVDEETGELVERQVYAFDNAGRGEVPDFKKDALIGQTVIITGISAEPEEFPLGLVRFLLLHPEGHDLRSEPFGVMIAAGSPIVGQVENMVKRGRVPFAGRIEKVASKSHKGYSYWRLSKPEPRLVG